MFWALLTIPAVVIFLILGRRWAAAALEALTGHTLRESLAPGASWRRNLVHTLLPTTAVALVVTALAGPRFGSRLVKVEREGIDLVIALDTSLSMLAEDMKPNRLERAKHEMIDLIRGLQGDRVGIVAFSGDAAAVCPLTVDYDAALMFTRSIDVYTVSTPGTAIARAIRASVALFDAQDNRDRVIILVTDGENQSGNPKKEAVDAGRRGIRIFTIGIGNPSGELIPERGTDGSITGYKKNRQGETVLTRLDESALQQIASASGGKYLPATNEGLELKVLYDAISGMHRGKISGQFVERRKERFWIALIAAGVLLLVDLMLGSVASGARRGRSILHSGMRAAVAVLALATLWALPARAGTIDAGKVRSGNQYYKQHAWKQALALYREAVKDSAANDNRLRGVMYNAGNAYQMMGKYPQALSAYQHALGDDTTLSGRMLYNRANTLVRAGKLNAAVQSYVQSLRFLPDDEQVRHNLEMTLRKLNQQKKKQKRKKRNQKSGNNNNKNQRQQPDSSKAGSRGDSTKTNEQNKNSTPDHQKNERQREQRPDSTRMQPQPRDSTAAAQSGDSTRARSKLPQNMMKLSKQDAMRILQALEEQEKKLQKKRRRAAFRRKSTSGKDW